VKLSARNVAQAANIKLIAVAIVVFIARSPNTPRGS
jgi:hypothetical protein